MKAQPTELAPVFTLAGARRAGWTKDQVYTLLRHGHIERVGHNVYARPEAIDPAWTALAAATTLQPTATLCLTSALVYHQLSDQIPFGADIALPRGTRSPAGFAHTTWHHFDAETFSLGRITLNIVPGTVVAVYSAPRTIVDCFRLADQEGSEVAYQALRRWLAQPDSSPADLLDMAGAFPAALPSIRHGLQVLL